MPLKNIILKIIEIDLKILNRFEFHFRTSVNNSINIKIKMHWKEASGTSKEGAYPNSSEWIQLEFQHLKYWPKASKVL